MQTKRQLTVNPQTKSTELGYKSTCKLLLFTPTIVIHYYYSAWKRIFILLSRGDGARKRWRNGHLALVKSKTCMCQPSIVSSNSLRIQQPVHAVYQTIIIWPITIVYSMGQIINSFCLCVCVCLSARTLIHGRISWSIFAKSGTEVKLPK